MFLDKVKLNKLNFIEFYLKCIAMLDYKLIEALAMVVQECGFEKAAVKLFVTPSAISQRIRALEEQTGQILINRTNPPKATEAGMRILKHYHLVKRLEEDLIDTFTPHEDRKFVTLAIGINMDSLTTWFLDAVKDFLHDHRILLDLKPADQDQTDQLLKDGAVIGCVSSKDKIIQGCRMDYLGCMEYRMLATPEYMSTWFPNGANMENICHAPLFIFDRKDELHLLYFREAFGEVPVEFSAHYLPSSEQFLKFIVAGLGCGMLPEQQSDDYLRSGKLVELVRGSVVRVDLYWHCWNLKSKLLKEFSENLVGKTRISLS